MKNLTVLLSCMHQDDASIVLRSNIRTDAVVINQCETDSLSQLILTTDGGKPLHVTYRCTSQRGLSRSRNMAIHTASAADICVLCDDDETFSDDYQQTIEQAYEQYPDADLIAFQVVTPDDPYLKKNYSDKTKRVGKLQALKIGSCQISFRRQSILDNNISFDEQMGSGTSHGCGEENKFLFDCLNKKLTIMYVPRIIATLNEKPDSNWFQGFTPRFFLERGWATARYMGKPAALLYAFYYAIKKYPLYHSETGFVRALGQMVVGIFKSTL